MLKAFVVIYSVEMEKDIATYFDLVMAEDAEEAKNLIADPDTIGKLENWDSPDLIEHKEGLIRMVKKREIVRVFEVDLNKKGVTQPLGQEIVYKGHDTIHSSVCISKEEPKKDGQK